MALKVLCGIASDIAESGYYSAMADERTDASNIEQLVIGKHWVDKKVMVCEEYIGLMPVAQTMQIQLSFVSKDMLLHMN